ncbi:hypothetical protein HXX76_007951 [Chlamydomonas incerta]|uniref:Uncharacterized protein n=1 Tax=Chlamydomonas incerta TaxID=51695 RepID=A0A835T9Y2_CHLIN|nr:hypothetical protein HXX76_007951 [Chlamydomonas incerta]|eukprot:KAG2434225.1 hypothetical protein HXX76_007951 [Chlamydomonas incerta]
MGNTAGLKESLAGGAQPTAVTVFSLQGVPLHQSPGSVAYFGDYSSCVRARAAGDTVTPLTQLFAHEPLKLEKLLKEVVNDGGGPWRDVVRVPASLVPTSDVTIVSAAKSRRNGTSSGRSRANGAAAAWDDKRPRDTAAPSSATATPAGATAATGSTPLTSGEDCVNLALPERPMLYCTAGAWQGILPERYEMPVRNAVSACARAMTVNVKTSALSSVRRGSRWRMRALHNMQLHPLAAGGMGPPAAKHAAGPGTSGGVSCSGHPAPEQGSGAELAVPAGGQQQQGASAGPAEAETGAGSVPAAGSSGKVLAAGRSSVLLRMALEEVPSAGPGMQHAAHRSLAAARPAPAPALTDTPAAPPVAAAGEGAGVEALAAMAGMGLCEAASGAVAPALSSTIIAQQHAQQEQQFQAARSGVRSGHRSGSRVLASDTSGDDEPVVCHEVLALGGRDAVTQEPVLIIAQYDVTSQLLAQLTGRTSPVRKAPSTFSALATGCSPVPARSLPPSVRGSVNGGRVGASLAGETAAGSTEGGLGGCSGEAAALQDAAAALVVKPERGLALPSGARSAVPADDGGLQPMEPLQPHQRQPEEPHQVVPACSPSPAAGGGAAALGSATSTRGPTTERLLATAQPEELPQEILGEEHVTYAPRRRQAGALPGTQAAGTPGRVPQEAGSLVSNRTAVWGSMLEPQFVPPTRVRRGRRLFGYSGRDGAYDVLNVLEGADPMTGLHTDVPALAHQTDLPELQPQIYATAPARLNQRQRGASPASTPPAANRAGTASATLQLSITAGGLCVGVVPKPVHGGAVEPVPMAPAAADPGSATAAAFTAVTAVGAGGIHESPRLAGAHRAGGLLPPVDEATTTGTGRGSGSGSGSGSNTRDQQLETQQASGGGMVEARVENTAGTDVGVWQESSVASGASHRVGMALLGFLAPLNAHGSTEPPSQPRTGS